MARGGTPPIGTDMDAADETAKDMSVRPIVLLSMAGFCAMAVLRVSEPILPEVAHEFGTTVGIASIMATAFALAYGVCQVFSGPFGDRYGKFLIITIALAASTIMVTATAWSDSLTMLAWLRFATGAATAAVIPLSLAYIGDIVPYERRQHVLARYITGTILGLMFGQAAGGLIIELAGWRSVFLVMGGLYAVMTVLCFFELRSARVDRRRNQMSVRVKNVLAQYRSIVTRPHAKRVLLTVFLEGFFLYGGVAYLGAFLRHKFAIDYATIGLLLAGFGIGGLSYILASRPIIRILGESGMVSLGGVSALAGYLMMILLPDWQFAALGNFLLGFGFSMLHNTLQTNATQMAPDSRGSAVSLFAFSLFLGQASGVALLGPVVDGFGYTPAFIACGLGMLCLGLWFGRRLKTQPNEP